MAGRLAIFGAGGHGRSVASTARAAGWECVFLDPSWPERKMTGAWPIVGTGDDEDAVLASCDAVHVALGDNAKRLALLRALLEKGARAPALVHPTAWVCPDVALGRGTVVMAQAAVNTGARVGDGVIVNTGAQLDHDGVLADGVHVSPGAVLAGEVSVGEGAWVATGASVLPRLTIGAFAVVGGGALVHRDVAAHTTVTGVPAAVRR